MAGAALRQTLLGAWRQRGPLAWLLWPLSLLYGGMWHVRRWLYRCGLLPTQHLPVPVIVVGNVVAGGGGKTPLVIALVQYLQSMGLRPGVIARGYGRSNQDCMAVTLQATADDVGDEPLLVHRRTGAPVQVATQRAAAARALLQRYPELDLLICDDGLQHLGLHRDIEICVFDDNGVGNGFLLPAGPLREPWPRACDLLVRSGALPGGAAHQIHRQLAAHGLRAVLRIGHRPHTEIEEARELRRLADATLVRQARPEVQAEIVNMRKAARDCLRECGWEPSRLSLIGL